MGTALAALSQVAGRFPAQALPGAGPGPGGGFPRPAGCPAGPQGRPVPVFHDAAGKARQVFLAHRWLRPVLATPGVSGAMPSIWRLCAGAAARRRTVRRHRSPDRGHEPEIGYQRCGRALCCGWHVDFRSHRRCGHRRPHLAAAGDERISRVCEDASLLAGKVRRLGCADAGSQRRAGDLRHQRRTPVTGRLDLSSGQVARFQY